MSDIYEDVQVLVRYQWDDTINFSSTCHTIKTNSIKRLDFWSKDMLNFNFSEKGLGLISAQHFKHDFSRQMSLMLHSIKWPYFVVWLPLLL